MTIQTPKFPTGLLVEINHLWLLGRVIEARWSPDHDSYIYYLEGQNINPNAPYLEKSLIKSSYQFMPQIWGEADEYLRWRVYLIQLPMGTKFIYRVWIDGVIQHEKKPIVWDNPEECIRAGVKYASKLYSHVLRGGA